MLNNDIKNLLGVHRNALRCLHDVLGLDFCAPFNMYHIAGKFTIKKVEKMIQIDGHSRYDSVIAIVMRGVKPWRKGEYNLVTVDSSGVNIEFKMPWYKNRGELNTFYRKGDFEETRKSEETNTYVFCQRKEYTVERKKESINYSERFKQVPVYSDRLYNWNVDRKGNRWISSIKLKQMWKSGENFEYKVNRYSLMPQTIDEIIDKSGYLVCERRQDLKWKATALRKEREQKAFAQTDNTQKIAELEKLILNRKSELVNAFMKAETSEEIYKVGEAISCFDGFSSTVRNFENLKSRDAEKSYPSVQAFDDAYNSILEKLNGKE